MFDSIGVGPDGQARHWVRAHVEDGDLIPGATPSYRLRNVIRWTREGEAPLVGIDGIAKVAFTEEFEVCPPSGSGASPPSDELSEQPWRSADKRKVIFNKDRGGKSFVIWIHLVGNRMQAGVGFNFTHAHFVDLAELEVGQIPFVAIPIESFLKVIQFPPKLSQLLK